MASDEKTPPSPNGHLSPDDLITLNEEIAGMARAGLPLDQGLTALARDMKHGRLRKVTGDLATDLRAGFTLPQALQRQGGRVPPFYSALLTAGIRSGRIGEVLGTLTLYARTIADFRDTVKSALVYPAVVFLLGIGLMVFVGIWILPEFIDIFEKFRLRLPLITQLLVFVGQHPFQVLVMPIVAVLALFLGVRWAFSTLANGRLIWARFIYGLPIFGTLIRSARLAAFTELLAIMADESVPLPEGLRLAAAASSDPLLCEGAARIEEDLRQGLPLGQALRQSALVPDLVVWMIGLGEKQGTLAQSLRHVAQLYHRQTELRAALVRAVLPPLLIILLAGLLGGLFLLGLMTPLVNLLEGLSGVGR